MLSEMLLVQASRARILLRYECRTIRGVTDEEEKKRIGKVTARDYMVGQLGCLD